MKATYRKYKTEQGAMRYAAKLNAELHEANARRVEAGKALSGVDFHYVTMAPDRSFRYAVVVVMTNGRSAFCA